MATPPEGAVEELLLPAWLDGANGLTAFPLWIVAAEQAGRSVREPGVGFSF